MSSNLWQLRRLSTNENLNEPQPLPKDWGPIFGLQGFVDKIGDLSWLGDSEYVDKGWFDTGIPTPPPPLSLEVNKEEMARSRAKILLTQSDWSMMPDVPMTSSKKQEWEAYRRALREIKLQPGFPDDVNWPNKPE
jgi:hypothetical protein